MNGCLVMVPTLQVAFTLGTGGKWAVVVQSVIQNGQPHIPCAPSVRPLEWHGQNQNLGMLGIVSISKSKLDLKLMFLWKDVRLEFSDIFPWL